MLFFYSTFIVLNSLTFSLLWDIETKKYKMCYDELIKYLVIIHFKTMLFFIEISTQKSLASSRNP